MTSLKLITIPMSHYCEKVRWALDYSGLSYTESAHLQGFHYLAVRGFGSGGLVPVLVTPDGPISNSSAILRWVDEHIEAKRKLYPAALQSEIRSLESELDQGLGVESRRWVYHYWKDVSPRDVLRIAEQGTPALQRAIAPMAMPLILKVIDRKLAASAARVETGRSIIDSAFDRIATLSNGGRSFLIGDRFSAADLCFACMAAPLLMPAEYAIQLPAESEIPARARADFARYREHPAGRFALRMFREFRRRA